MAWYGLDVHCVTRGLLIPKIRNLEARSNEERGLSRWCAGGKHRRGTALPLATAAEALRGILNQREFQPLKGIRIPLVTL